MLVILNDNQMFISKKIGVLAGYFAKLLTAGSVKKIEDRVKDLFQELSFGD
jgi:1-deoxy-D-xylulose-5-phosphate synthase